MISLKNIRVDEWILITASILISTIHIDLFYYEYDAPKWIVFDVFLSIYALLNFKHLRNISLNKFGLALTCFLLTSLICSIQAPNFGEALQFIARLFLALTTGYILLSRYNTAEFKSLFITLVVYSAAAFVILFYLERYILQLDTNVGSFSPLGFINNTGQVFNIWIPVLVLATFTYIKQPRLLLFIAPVLIAIVSILMEASVRGSIIGLFIGEGLVFLIMLWKDKTKALLFLSTSALLLIGIGSYKFIDALEGGRLSSKISELENAISPSNARLKLFGNTYDMILDNPLGVGTNNFEYVHPKYAQPGTSSASPYVNEHQILRTPHNIILKITSETGILGGLIFLTSLALIFFMSISNAIKGSMADRWLLASLTALLFHSLLSAVFLTPASLLFSIYLFSFISCSFNQLRTKKAPTFELQIRKEALVVPVLILLLSLSDGLSRILSFQGRHTLDSTALEQSLSFNPYNQRALFSLSHAEYRRNKDTQASLNAIDNFIALYPYHLQANYIKSERLFQLKEYQKADNQIRQLIDIYPNYAKAQRLAKVIRTKLN